MKTPKTRTWPKSTRFHLAVCLALGSPVALAGGIQTLQEVEVVGAANNLVGVADSATQGTVTAQQLENRPLLRPGELLETVPGLIITQHSGDGKANQYFLRGFNLDHGTDLAVFLDGMPVNMPTHGHGQGYADLNFLIPELVAGLRYKKGPYFADEGDFSAAGAVRVSYADKLASGIAELGVGQFGFRRGLVAASPTVGSGHLLYALEWFANDGPWDHPENLRKVNAVLRYGQGTNDDGWSVAAMAYDANWSATDQVPQRAIDAGLISRFGAIDPTDGGRTHRYSLSGQWAKRSGEGVTRANAYVIDYGLNLFSNFTFFLDDPVRGDQFEQADKRVVSGGSLSHTWLGKLGGRDVEHTLGTQFRNDAIQNVALYHTVAQQRIGTTRADHVFQTSVSAYYQGVIQWNDWLRTLAGVRSDFYRFQVDSDTPANSGRARDHIVSPKLGFVLGPWNKTEYYLNIGRGFHSNDARGATITVDPADGVTPVDKVKPLVPAKGAEVGVRTALVPGLQSSLALWRLDIDSELVFAGDAGTTEPSFASHRHGIEWANYWQVQDGLTVDADLALSRARFSDDPAGDRIPGAIEKTLSVGASIDRGAGWFGGARLRYFGPRPLIEDNSVRSKSSTLVNARVGYKFGRDWQVALDAYNLFDRKVSDIDYFYTSRLPGEPAGGVDDIHTHPAEPRVLRLTLSVKY